MAVQTTWNFMLKMTIMSIAAFLCILHIYTANECANSAFGVRVRDDSYFNLEVLSVMPRGWNDKTWWPPHACIISPIVGCWNSKCMHASYEIWLQFLIFAFDRSISSGLYNRIIFHYLTIVFCFSNRPFNTRSSARITMWNEQKSHLKGYHITYTRVYPSHVRLWCGGAERIFHPNRNWNRTIVQMYSKLRMVWCVTSNLLLTLYVRAYVWEHMKWIMHS